MCSCQTCLFGGFLVHRPRGRTSFTSPPCFSPPYILCLLTHQLYSYCLKGSLACCIKHNLFRWINLLQYVLQKINQNYFSPNVLDLRCCFKIWQDYAVQVKVKNIVTLNFMCLIDAYFDNHRYILKKAPFCFIYTTLCVFVHQNET